MHYFICYIHFQLHHGIAARGIGVKVHELWFKDSSTRITTMFPDKTTILGGTTSFLSFTIELKYTQKNIMIKLHVITLSCITPFSLNELSSTFLLDQLNIMFKILL
jgi:hypothetical protein